MQLHTDVGHRLKLLRQCFGWSQRELAKRAGVPNSAVSMIENDHVSPTVSSLKKLLDVFPITLSAFFSLDMELRCVELHACSEGSQHGRLSFDRLSIAAGEVGVCMHRLEANQIMRGFISNDPVLIMLSQGVLEITCFDTSFRLDVGDSLAINSIVAYQLQALGSEAHWFEVMSIKD